MRYFFTINFRSFFYALREKTRSTRLTMIELNKILKEKKIFFCYFLFVSVSSKEECSSSGQDLCTTSLESVTWTPPFFEAVLYSSMFEILIRSSCLGEFQIRIYILHNMILEFQQTPIFQVLEAFVHCLTFLTARITTRVQEQK